MVKLDLGKVLSSRGYVAPLYFASVQFSAIGRARADTLSHRGREVFPPALTRVNPQSKVARGLPTLPSSLKRGHGG